MRKPKYDFKYEINMGVFVPNLILNILGIATFCLLLAAFVLSCTATCCYNPIDLQISLFEPVTSAEVEEDRQAYLHSLLQAPTIYYVPQGFGGASMQPVIMISGGNQASPYQTFQLVPDATNNSLSSSGESLSLSGDTLNAPSGESSSPSDNSLNMASNEV